MSKPGLPVAAVVTRVAVIAVGLALFFGQAGARHVLHLDVDESSAGSPVVYWISLLAPAFFLWALWAASNVIVRIGKGNAFEPAMVRGLREIGAALMLGSFCAIVVQPSLIFLVGNGFRELRGVTFALDVENLMLALVGLVLVMLAREGQRIKSSLEEFV